ncbi:MAG: hypothetical protein R3Y50_03470 [Rikenellaceae bacterium]
MKKDILFGIIILVIFAPFIVSSDIYSLFMQVTAKHPYMMAFLKFAILATVGEVLGMRIKRGIYSYEGFGIVPRIIVWGLFGIFIAVGMKIFSVGAPAMVESFGVDGVVESMKGELTPKRVLGAFATSVMMNSLFAPVFMTLHKITDTHIFNNNGSLKSLITPIKMEQIITSLDWKVQWGFVFKKTIPLFWIPAHTITFLLPQTSQVLFAALLSIALGLILSIASLLSRDRNNVKA